MTNSDPNNQHGDAIPQEPIEADPTHDHDPEALKEAAERFAVIRDDDE